MSKLSSIGNVRISLKKELERLINKFEKLGSSYVEIPTLLQSDLLLDLYGEELNSRTYIFNDPVKGNLMLRPDFTVPIVQLHIKTNTKKYSKLNKNFNLNLTLQQYSKLFDDFSKNIKQGKTYQIKIAQTYSKKGNINAIDLFWKLMQINESPESFLIRDKGYSIISCSPETLLLKKGDLIKTKPIAGTLRKTKKINHNKALAFFRRNEKETKEHNMIVDMERNDLSKICKTGSVKIDKLKTVEEYRDLFHYVTTIKGVLKNKITNHDIISSLMPGGSVIGCPKISTIQLLNQKEKSDRNIYTGSFGIIHSNGDMRFNIMIRTLLNFKNAIELSVASGVILGSTAKKEYNENYIKAKSLLDLFN